MRQILPTALAAVVALATGCVDGFATDVHTLADYSRGTLSIVTMAGDPLTLHARLDLPDRAVAGHCPGLQQVLATLDGTALGSRGPVGGATYEMKSGLPVGEGTCDPVSFQGTAANADAPTTVFEITEAGSAVTVETATSLFAPPTLSLVTRDAGVLHRGEKAFLSLSVATDLFIAGSAPSLTLNHFTHLEGDVTDREISFIVPNDAVLGAGFVEASLEVLPEITRCEGVATCDVRMAVPEAKFEVTIAE